MVLILGFYGSDFRIFKDINDKLYERK